MPVWAQVLGVVVPLLIAVLGLMEGRSAQKKQKESADLAASKAAELEAKKVDQKAFEIAEAIYKKAIDSLEAGARRDRETVERQQVVIERQEIQIEEFKANQRRLEAEITWLRERLSEVEMSTLQMQDKRLKDVADGEAGGGSGQS